MVVEDKAPLRAITARILEREGYKVITAGNGLEALSRAETVRGGIDLLLTDVVMPEMLGQVLADTMRLTQPEIRSSSPRVRAARAGAGRPAADGPLLQKPLSAAELLTHVADVVGRE